jgi:hypothetical protein
MGEARLSRLAKESNIPAHRHEHRLTLQRDRAVSKCVTNSRATSSSRGCAPTSLASCVHLLFTVSRAATSSSSSITSSTSWFSASISSRLMSSLASRLAELRLDLPLPPGEGVGNVLEEDEAEDGVFIDGGVEVGAKPVGGVPEFFVEVFEELVTRFVHSCGKSLSEPDRAQGECHQ